MRRLGGFAILALLVVILAFRFWPRGSVPVTKGVSAEVSSDRAHAAPLFATPVRESGIAGTVFDPRQRPLAGARVCASRSDAGVQATGPALCVETDAGGRYALRGLAPASYEVTASAEAFAAASARDGQAIPLGEQASLTDIDITLRLGGAKVTGVVLDATGGPIAHASVRGVRFASPMATLVVEGDDRGRFTLWFPPGQLSVSAEADGYAPSGVDVRAPATNVEIVLTPGAALRGVVVAAGSGDLVPNIEVRAAPIANPSTTVFRSSMTDPEGAFVVKGLEPGTYALVAAGAGWRGELPYPVPLGLTASVENLRIEVQPAAEVTGRVLIAKTNEPCARGFARLGPPDPTQAPPGEAELQRAPPAGAPTSALEFTSIVGAGGVVHFPAVPPGRYYVSVQCFDNVLREGPRVLDIGTKALADLTWKVGPGGRLTVVVVDEANHPVAGANFLIRMPQSDPKGSVPILPGQANEDGRFEYPAMLRSGSYEVTARPPFEAQHVTVELPDRDEAVEAKLVVVGSGAIVATVHAAGGEPVEGLQVSASLEAGADAGSPTLYGAVTLGNGRYRIGPLKAGRYRLQVDDAANPAVHVNGIAIATASVAELSVQLPRSGEIRGRVIDNEGIFVPNVWVSAAVATDPAPGEPAGFQVGPVAGGGKRVLTDPDGQFVLGGLAIGDATYTVRAEDPSGASASQRGVHVGRTDVVVTLPPLRTISGAVVDARGAPAAGVTIQATSGDTGHVVTTEATADGKFLLKGLSPGPVSLTALRSASDGLAVASADVVLLPTQNLAGVHLVLQAPVVAQAVAAAPPAP